MKLLRKELIGKSRDMPSPRVRSADLKQHLANILENGLHTLGPLLMEVKKLVMTARMQTLDSEQTFWSELPKFSNCPQAITWADLMTALVQQLVLLTCCQRLGSPRQEKTRDKDILKLD